MYKIFMDGELVWTNETPDVGLYSAKVTLEANSTNSLEISVANGFDAFTNARMLQSIVEVYQDNEVDPIFKGRPLNKKTDFQGNTTYKFEGVLGYLYDSIQPPVDYTGQTPRYILEHLIAEHNSQTEDYKHFKVGDVTIIDNTESDTYTGVGRLHDEDSDKDPAYTYQYDSNKTGTNQTDLTTGYESTFDAINNLLINNLSGNLVVRFQNGTMILDYLEKYLDSEGQVILFGSNLLDYSSTLDYSSICSGILPLGYSRGSDDYDKDDPDNPEHPGSEYTDEDDPLQTVKSKLTIESVNGGSKILWDQGMINTYGRIVKAVEWSNCKDANKLLEKAKAYLYKKQYDNLTLECKIIDLHFVDSTEKPLHHMHMVEVKSEPHGLDKMMPINKMDIDLMNPANDTISLGQAYNSITGEMANTKDQVSKVTGQAANNSTTISNNAKTAWTNISQTDEKILLEAHSREESEQKMQTYYDAQLEITSKQIKQEVTERQEQDGKLLKEIGTVQKQTAHEWSITNKENGKGIKLTIKDADGNELGSTDISLDADNVDINAKDLNIQATDVNFTGETVNFDNGKIIVTTDDGFKKRIGGKDYSVLSTRSLENMGSDDLRRCVANMVTGSAQVKSAIRSVVHEVITEGTQDVYFHSLRIAYMGHGDTKEYFMRWNPNNGGVEWTESAVTS